MDIYVSLEIVFLCGRRATTGYGFTNTFSECPRDKHSNSRSSEPRRRLGMTTVCKINFPHLMQRGLEAVARAVIGHLPWCSSSEHSERKHHDENADSNQPQIHRLGCVAGGFMMTPSKLRPQVRNRRYYRWARKSMRPAGVVLRISTFHVCERPLTTPPQQAEARLPPVTDA